MDFEHSERAQQHIGYVEQFVRERVLPMKRRISHNSAQRRLAALAHPADIEQLKGEAKAAACGTSSCPTAKTAPVSTTATMRR
jgi:hypothetical protein